MAQALPQALAQALAQQQIPAALLVCLGLLRAQPEAQAVLR